MNLLLVFLLSMAPVIELKGAIPLGIASHLNPILVTLVAIIGNTLPVIPIYYFAHKFLVYFQDNKYIGFLCKKFLIRGEKIGKKIENKFHNKAYLALFIYVAIPLPGTGVWTATLASSILNLNVKKVFIANFLGVIVASIIISVTTTGIINII